MGMFLGFVAGLVVGALGVGWVVTHLFDHG